MNWFLLGIAVLALRIFWGMGLALLILPPRLRRYWLAFAPLAGASLQMAVVWIGSALDWPGTDSYAWASLALPTSLLWAAAFRSGPRLLLRDLAAGQRLWGCGAAMIVVLAVLLLPASFNSRSPTTISLGSCDAGSYAAGAEAFKRYASSDHRGFLGQAGRNAQIPDGGMQDLWKEKDHFGPVALLAMSASYIGKDVFQVATIDAATYWAILLPMVFWIARHFLRMGATAALAVTLVLAVCPLSQYVVHHSMLGQLLATGAVCLIWWASAEILEKAHWRRVWPYVAWVGVGNGLLIGSYAFFLPLVYAPIVAYAVFRTLFDGGGFHSKAWRGRGEGFGRWLEVMALSGAIAAGFYFRRFVGLPELYSSLRGIPFGWDIPTFNLMGLIGWFETPDLRPGSTPMSRLAALGLGFGIAACLWKGLLGRRWLLMLASVLMGSLSLYWIFGLGLLNEGGRSSYQAFKILAISFPLVFLVLCGGLRVFDEGRVGWWLAGAVVAGSLIYVNGFSSSRFAKRVSRAPLVVDALLSSVRLFEDRDDVQSVNILFPHVWARLWSSGFILTKEQYYDAPSYEGRPRTPLDGEWDLNYSSVATWPAAEKDFIRLNPMYQLTRRDEAAKVTLDPGENRFYVDPLDEPLLLDGADRHLGSAFYRLDLKQPDETGPY